MVTVIKKLFLILFGVFLFFSLELICRLIVSDKNLSQLESILGVIEEDETLFWRQRPNLNVEFQGVEVITNSLGYRNKEIDNPSSKDVFRIICLGASPTFGWGVEQNQAYPFVLEQKLKVIKQPIEVINAGQIGYSTHQGLKLFKTELLNYSPDLITVSYVLNDLDRYRFYRNEGLTDKELKTGKFPGWVIGLKNMMAQSKLYLVLKRGFSYLAARNDQQACIAAKKQFHQARIRVPVNDYKANLEKFISICKKNSIKLVFIKMPVNLSLPTQNEEDKKMSNPSAYYYELGLALEKKKEYREACKCYKKAKDYLALKCHKDRTAYNKSMEEIAVRNNIPLVDAVAIFTKQGEFQGLFNGKSDPTHPNARGHRLIAEGLYTTILKNNLIKEHSREQR